MKCWIIILVLTGTTFARGQSIAESGGTAMQVVHSYDAPVIVPAASVPRSAPASPSLSLNLGSVFNGMLGGLHNGIWSSATGGTFRNGSVWTTGTTK